MAARDWFVLATDAIAAWLSQESELDTHPWTEIRELSETNNPQSAFAEWVDEKRSLSHLKNDDVTCLVIYL